MIRVNLHALLTSTHLAGPLDGNVLLEIGRTIPTDRYVEIGRLKTGAKLLARKAKNGHVCVYVSGYAPGGTDVPTEIIG